MPALVSPWQRRLRRFMYLFGAGSVIYLIFSYTLDRMREARIKASREKRQRDLLKNHFTSLISTISYTLYALLPTLQPQILEYFPVESTSQSLQGLASMSSSITSSGQVEDPPKDSLLLQSQSTDGQQGVGGSESWASEFHTGSTGGVDTFREEGVLAGPASDAGVSVDGVSFLGDSVQGMETDDTMSSTLSQPISLPLTDISSPSPPSDMSQSQLHPSPPRPTNTNTNTDSNPTSPTLPPPTKSKKELWHDLKIQTISRAITTAYLVPLLHILTTSQLSTLSREHYLQDIKARLSPPSDESSTLTSVQSPWYAYLSTTSMGLSEYISPHIDTSIIPNPLKLLPNVVRSRIQFPFFTSTPQAKKEVDVGVEGSVALKDRLAEEERRKDEAERVYLSYSWWVLNEGWKGVAERVREVTEDVFGGVGLKREFSVEDWETLIREVRARVETTEKDGIPILHDFSQYLIPFNPLLTTHPSCPLPSNPSSNPHLQTLLDQTRDHLASPDTPHLLQLGVSAMIGLYLDTLSQEVYTFTREEERVESGSDASRGKGRGIGQGEGMKRLVDCLPCFGRVGKGVWESIPDCGVESVLGINEFEGFAALIFGDWAPRD